MKATERMRSAQAVYAAFLFLETRDILDFLILPDDPSAFFPRFEEFRIVCDMTSAPYWFFHH
ncbi:hypothetical protein SJA_C1-11340 [Sphingobium indicum UT26S]|uniref:Uncharacterized protein n=1 Tax=Sphingobium indicum (strain DSM 16413 / CCM 7287 / MTCC 6362 / UT26 / NBRC 101211 / UT26S) TaxID=452662 RepID=D4Z036_SPHIU|nr:hypothetical protein SJA_C1-11340 [Sphingobium indicum UT26S]